MTEQEIINSMKQAKWTEQKKRMAEADKYIDFYNFRQDEEGYCSDNRQSSYMRDYIQTLFPNSAGKLYPYIRCYPITEQITNDISIMFQQPPRITLNPDKPLADNAPASVLFKDEIVDKPMLYPNLIAINRYVNLTGKVGVMPRWYEAGKQIEYVILTPDKCFVIQDEDSPNHITALIYKVDEMQDTPGAVVKKDKWIMVTAEEFSKVEIDSNGNPKVLESIPNVYKTIPVAWFQNSISLDGFWNDKGNPIVDFNMAYNANKTLEKLAITYQSYSTLFLKDFPPNKTIDWGVNAVLRSETDSGNPNASPDAKFLTPSPLLKEVSDIIENELSATAVYAGLSKEAFRKEASNFTSGYQLKLSKQDVINNAELEKPFYTAGLKQLLSLAVLVYSTHSTNTLQQITSFGIDYKPLTFEQNALDVWTVRTFEKQNKVKSRIDFIMEDNPEMSRDEAIKRAEQIDKDFQQYGGLMMESLINSQDNGNNQEEDTEDSE